MTPDKHIVSGIILGAGAYAITGNMTLSAASFLSAFMCDIDHAIEYGMYCARTKVKPTLKEFSSGEYFAKKDTICVIFHAYEYLAALIIAAIITRHPAAVGIAMGYALHLVLDTIGNDCTFIGYCITYRIKVKFSLSKVCVKNKAR